MEVVSSINAVSSKQIGDALYKGYSFDLSSNKRMFIVIDYSSQYETNIRQEGCIVDGKILFVGMGQFDVPDWTRMSIITTKGSCQIIAQDTEGSNSTDVMHLFYENMM